MAVSETDVVREIRSDYKYGFSNPDAAKDYFFKSGRVSRTRSWKRSRSTRKSPTGCGSSGTSRSTTSSLGRCRAGAPTSRGSTSRTSTTTSGPQKSRPTRGRPARRHQGHVGQARDPGGGEEVPAGVGAQYESEVVYHKLQADLEAKGVLFLDMDSGLREHEDIVKQYMGTIIPQNDNKFAALKLRGLVGRRSSTCRRESGSRCRSRPTSHQRGEHGPVGAHADHRRRGRIRALRRGLHGADLFVRLTALGRRRDHRQARGSLSVHDDPELVEQRLQPRDEAAVAYEDAT